MPPKRILYIHHGSARGGAFLSLLYLITALDRTKYEPIVCSSEADREVLDLFEKNGCRTCACRLTRFAHTTGGTYNLLRYAGWRQFLTWLLEYNAAARRLKTLLLELKPDLVHFNSLTLAPYAKVPDSMCIPTIVHVRESIVNGLFGIRRKWLTRQIQHHAGKVIAICQDNLDRLHLNEEKSSVIYNPVDMGKFDFRIDRSLARKKLGIPDRAPVTLFAGGSVWDAKGLSEFIKAMHIVRTKMPGLICLMPGFSMPADPAQRLWTLKRRIAWMLGLFRKSDRFFRLFKENGLDTKIICCDFVYDIENWLAACDVVCVPHMQPHFSRTVMEAGAMKKPVSGFSIGGVSEVVQNDVTGLLVRRGDVSALADATIKLLEDPVLAGRLGEAGYRQAAAKFSADHSAQQVEKNYEELIQ